MCVLFLDVGHLKKYQVLYDFKNDDSNYDSLELEEGDIICIVGGEENGWFLAQMGFSKGLVPATYVHLLENQDGKTTHLPYYIFFLW